MEQVGETIKRIIADEDDLFFRKEAAKKMREIASQSLSNVLEQPITQRRINLDDKKQEKVDHPKHYNDHPAGIECIDIIEHFDFCIGNAIKYLWRAGLKDRDTLIEDLEKAQWYIKRKIEQLGKLAKDK